MIISKHIHSCLLIKEQGKVILIDPGNFSVENKAINLESLNQIDYLLITHEHQDHMDIPFIKSLVNKFPTLPIISTQSVVDIMSKENIKASTEGNEFIEVIDAPHAPIFGMPQFQNILFNVFSTLTDPGDNLTFTQTQRVLALPIQAPWGSLTQAVDKAMELKPEVIIPIHDWHWRDEIRIGLYKRLENYFTQNGIKFRGVETGEEIEV